LERWDNLTIVLDEIEDRFPRRGNANPTFHDLRNRHDSARHQSND
jgi:hypothetical protein